MRVAASVLTLIAAAVVGTATVRAQPADKPAQSPSSQMPQKAQKAQKAQQAPRAAATPERSVQAPVRATPAASSKVEGASTMRSTPADAAKGGGCHSMSADDA